ncbi:hypothetical protein BJP25_07800 [Actinokineospora bangkokensis]|uniref:Regulatory protein RecX n=1 Tax=Actinokineospora bangkokensis TaxID=1193682 RepID=A0A1Q9LT84_9PSEU|nr:hypothetical protein BJP25_07800 [Actinokineospora bangkokensis]
MTRGEPQTEPSGADPSGADPRGADSRGAAPEPAEQRPAASDPSAGPADPPQSPPGAAEPGEPGGRRFRRRTAQAAEQPTAPRSAKGEQDPAARARDICYRLLTMRDHTRLELEQALRKREVPEEVIHATLAKFDKAGLINDEAFAESWVRARHEHKGLGRRAIAQELRRKGVDQVVVEEALSDLDADAEQARAAELVRRKLGSTRGLDRQKRIRRLVAMLARRGYAEGMAYGVVRAALDAEDADTDTDTDERIEWDLLPD